MTSRTLIAALLLIVPVVAAAENAVDGTWTGQVGADAAAHTITFVMRTDEIRLSGSIIAGSTETAIEEGTFTGSTLAFKSMQRDGERKRQISCLGTLIDDSISFSCTADGKPEIEEFVVTRQQQNQGK